MLPSLIDFVFVAYIIYGKSRGKMRGLTKELPKLLGVLLAFMTGLGLLRWTGRALVSTAQFSSQITSSVGVIGSLIAAYLIIRHFRKKIRMFVENRFPEAEQQQRTGAIAGALRATLVIAFLIGVISNLQLRFLEKHLVERPIISRCITTVTHPLFRIADQDR